LRYFEIENRAAVAARADTFDTSLRPSARCGLRRPHIYARFIVVYYGIALVYRSDFYRYTRDLLNHKIELLALPRGLLGCRPGVRGGLNHAQFSDKLPPGIP
jgi:hypothetical protein